MIEINNQTRSEIDIKLVEKVARKFLEKYKISDSLLSIAFVGDQAMQKLNKKYRGIDKSTDILSFCEDKKKLSENLGEIIIDYSQIRRQSKIFSETPKEELVFILVHGLFHLLGYKDDTEKGKKEMDKLGKEFIKNVLKYD